MKRLVRSVLEPSPRTVSVKSLALLVGGLLCGIGISVREYLQSSRPAARGTISAPTEPGTCRREIGRGSSIVPLPSGDLSCPSSTVQDPPPAPTKRAAASVLNPAPTQWTPDDGSTSGLGDETSSASSVESPIGQIGRVSSQ